MASDLAFPVYNTALDWTATEEILLLEAIEMYGFGNWSTADLGTKQRFGRAVRRSIAAHVSTKSDSACEDHYHSIYLDHSTAPLPPESIWLEEKDISRVGNVSGSSRAAAAAGEEGKEEKEEKEASLEEKGLPGGGSTSALLLATGGALRSGPADARPVPVSASEVEVSGYMPLRNDFDVEHDNDAELALADLEFREGEHPTETELKLKVIEIYNARLDERERRKRFVVERGLLDYKTAQSTERRRTRAEREIRNQLRPFARFQTHEEHEALVEGLSLELRLRRRIAQLQEYRRLGIRTLAEADDYETERKRRETRLALRKSKQSASYLFAGTAAEAAADASVVSRGRRRSGASSKGTVGRTNSKKSETATPKKGETTPAPAEPYTKPPASASSSSKPPSAAAAAAEPDFPPSDLQENEIELCKHLQLVPSQFTNLRNAIIAAAKQQEEQKLSLEQAREAANSADVSVNQEAADATYDLCVTLGWVTAPGGASHDSKEDKDEEAALQAPIS